MRKKHGGSWMVIFLACTLAIVMALANLVKPGKKPEAAAE